MSCQVLGIHSNRSIDAGQALTALISPVMVMCS